MLWDEVPCVEIDIPCSPQIGWTLLLNGKHREELYEKTEREGCLPELAEVMYIVKDIIYDETDNAIYAFLGEE